MEKNNNSTTTSNNKMFADKLQAMRATYVEKHSALVEIQRQQVISKVNQILDDAHAEIHGLCSEKMAVYIAFSSEEFLPNGIQPETEALLEDLGFTKLKKEQGQSHWYANFRW